MAISLVASVTRTGGTNGGTTAAIDTTGATLLVIGVAWYSGGGGSATVSDSKGNVYGGLTFRSQGGTTQQLFYKLAPVVGTGHTFTVSGTSIFPGVVVHAFAGVASYETESNAGTAGAGPLATGSVTPTINGALILTIRGANNAATTDSLSPVGFAITTALGTSGTNSQASLGYYVQPTAGAINPTWSWTVGSPTPTEITVTTGVFLPAVGLPAPIAYWPFNEGSGPTAADASGNGHTATLGHGTWDTSALRKFGAAALKNTDGGYGASFAAISLGTVYSIAFWMNGWDGTNDGLSLGNTAGIGYASYHNSTTIYHEVGASIFVSRPVTGLTGSHHVVVTRNGTTVTFYKDGTSLGSQTLSSNPAFSVDTISGHASGAAPLVATLDDVRLYDVALSGAQVAELYALNPDIASVARVSHTVVELLGLPVPAGRLTQHTIELLSSMTVPGRVTQYVVEFLSDAVLPKDYTWQIKDLTDASRWMTGLLVFPVGETPAPAGTPSPTQVVFAIPIVTQAVFHSRIDPAAADECGCD